MRRDLTMNAIALNQKTNEYIDPFGGVDDIKNGVIRHVSEAFSEDPLRVLRTARFLSRYSHLGFKVADETIKLMQVVAKSGELEHLTNERVFGEIKSALECKSPEKFFECLRETGSLEVILPELNSLWGIPQSKSNHPEIDTGIHTMMSIKVAKMLTESVETLFGLLLHDLGKGITPTDELPRHIGHEAAGIPLVKDVCQRLKVPSSYSEFALIFCKEHLRIHRCMEMSEKKLLELLIKLDSNRKPDRLIQFCIAGQSDACGRLGMEGNPYPQSEYLQGAAKALKSVNLSVYDFRTERGKQDAHKAKLNALKEFKKLSGA